jgi:hypothetical protein
MAAPALAASIADAAISPGVTGTARLRAGVSADPVMAQLTMILRGIRSARDSLSSVISLLDAQIRVANDLSPLCDLALDAGAEFFRFIRHRFETKLEQALFNFWIRDRFGDLAL